MYFSAKEILAQLDGTDMRICDLVIKNETEISEISREEIFSMLEERYQIMYNSAHDALEKEIRSLSGLTGGSAKKCGNTTKKAPASVTIPSSAVQPMHSPVWKSMHRWD